MKLTLKNYQEDALEDILLRLESGKVNHARDARPSSFALTATTGAGKTVIAAAAIEALFYGNDKFDFDPDPGAVVIWFSDDPSLNDQTRSRLMAASEVFTSSGLVAIEPPFAKPQLEPGKVYFLNTQKLGKNSLLTRGHEESESEDQGRLDVASPDMQGWTIWETIGNTINDPDRTVYLVIDEAHRGYGANATRGKATLVRKLVDGHAGYPPIPVVWGISATADRFREAMKEANRDHSRRALGDVVVDGFRVQEEGLVKDKYVVQIPNEPGDFDSVLVRRAARILRDYTERWSKYSTDQGSSDTVYPLLVLQSPNSPDHDKIGVALDTIFDELKDMPAFVHGNAVRHVFGEHTTQKFGAWDVDWIEPPRVQETSQVRILIAKDAISTGWDCPRAEVLVSFRPAKDRTYITQIVGRMARNPLARRVPGDEILNSVHCVLPFFDTTTAGQVIKLLSNQIEDIPSLEPTVILEPCELGPNESLPEAVWEAWDATPTETVPRKGESPVKRLVALAHALSFDSLAPGALKSVEAEMHAVLDGLKVRYDKQLNAAAEEVWAVRGLALSARTGVAGVTYEEFVERADDRAIRVAFDDAKRAFGADIAQTYVDHLTDDDDEDSLRDAFVTTSALGYIPAARAQVDREASELATKLFATHRTDILGLNDERRQAYEDIRALAVEPQRASLGRPRTRIEDYLVVDEAGQTSRAPMVAKHLMSDPDGLFPVSGLNPWEREVVELEMSRNGAQAWYRNPPRQTFDSVGVPYRDGLGNWRSMHPDFIFFHEVRGRILPSIVDPHGHHLGDSMTKLKGLVDFAKTYADEFHRIESVTKIAGVWKVLDIKAVAVMDAIKAAAPDLTVDVLYSSPLAIEYLG